jgi:hypothetical protein
MMEELEGVAKVLEKPLRKSRIVQAVESLLRESG